MRNISAITQDPNLEELMIHYVGVRHMAANWDHFIDPAIPYDWLLQEHFYRVMRDGTFGDLKRALRKTLHIKASDPDFQDLIEGASQVIVDRYGMEEIVAVSREFLRAIATNATEPSGLEQVDFSAPHVTCGICGKQAISMGFEDLPMHNPLRGHASEESLYAYCKHCQEITERS